MRRIFGPFAFAVIPAVVSAQDQIHNIYGGSTTGRYGSVIARVERPDTWIGQTLIIVGAPDVDAGGTDAGYAEVLTVQGGLLAALSSPAAGIRFGAAVSGIGDFDNDGYPEVAIGAPGDDTNGTDAGAVYVYNPANGALIKSLFGFQAGEQFGFALASLKDINADGYRDLAVASPTYDAAGLTNCGRVRAYSSSTWNVLATATGLNSGDQFGRCVAEGGDLDGNGISDILVGAPFADVGSATNAGKAYIVNGLTGAIMKTFSGVGAFSHFGTALFSLSSSGLQKIYVGSPEYSGSLTEQGRVDAFSASTGAALWTQTGQSTGAHFGAALGFGGYEHFIDPFTHMDATGDPLIAIGAPDAFGNGKLNAGMMRVVNYISGATQSTTFGSSVDMHLGNALAYARGTTPILPMDPVVEIVATGAPGGGVNWTAGRVVYGAGTGYEFTRYGPKTGIEFGAAVSAIGDLDGDGRADFAVGAPNDEGLNSQAGSVHTYSGAGGNLRWAKLGSQSLSRFGAALAPAGDVDHDGIPDLIVGAPMYDVTSPFAEGAAYILSGSTGSVLRSHFGSALLDHFGTAVAGGGDVNNDGRDDYAVGVPDHNAITTDSGMVKVYSGVTGSELFTFFGSSAGEELGRTLALAGDVNLDGFVDVAAGVPGASSGAGCVRIWSGKTGALLRTLTSTGSLELGRALAAGDVNLDGVPDQIVGAHRKATFSLVNQGAVLVFNGANGFLLCSAVGEDVHDELGISVAFVGDVNRDGFADFAAGAVDATSSGTPGRGTVRVLSGFDGVKLHEVSGNAIGDNYGAALAGLGDVDGDGIGDWIAGAPNNALAGPDAGMVEVWATTQNGLSLFGIGTFGCNGLQVIWGNATPKVGTQQFRVSLTQAPPSSLSLGLVTDAWLQFGQDPFGLGILMHVDLFAASVVVTLDLPSDAAGRSQAALPIPNNPVLYHQTFYAQAISAWPQTICTPSTYGLSSSPGLKIVIQ